MSDEKDDILNQDLDDLNSSDELSAEEQEWEDELQDESDQVDDLGESDGEFDDEVIEFESEDQDDDGDSKTKSYSKKSKNLIPLIAASSVGLGLIGFVAANNLGVFNSPAPPNIVSNEEIVEPIDKPLGLDLEKEDFENPGDSKAELVDSTNNKNGGDLSINLNNNPSNAEVSLDGSTPVIEKANILDEPKDSLLNLNNEPNEVSSTFNIDVSGGENNSLLTNDVSDSLEEKEKVVVDLDKGALVDEGIVESDSVILDEVKLKSVISDALIENFNGSNVENMFNSMSSQLNLLNQDLVDLNSELSDLNSKEPLKKKRLSSSEKAALTNGRVRLKGMHVINTSEDGTMSIVEVVKKPHNRVRVFFKGERIILSGKGSHEIKGIHDLGYLVLVNDKWYIDDVFEKPVLSSIKKKIKPVNKNTISLNKKVIIENKKNSLPLKENVINYGVANGWILNGIYSEKFLIQTPTGEWLTAKVGDELKGLGIVNGLDKDNNLMVGRYLIINVKN